MNVRTAMLIGASAVALLGVAALAVKFAMLAPASVLFYARADEHGAAVAAIARSRARFWGECPRDAFLPATPVGAVTAALDGVSPAEEQSLLALARIMISKGCGINDYSQAGTTPLMDAVIFGSARSVRLLLDLGADRSLPKKPSTGRGPSPIDGMNAKAIAERLVSRPAGPHGDRKAVLRELSPGG